MIEISSYYKHTLLVSEGMINSCDTKKELEEVILNMQTQHCKHFAENCVLPYTITNRSTTVFDQNDTNQQSVP